MQPQPFQAGTGIGAIPFGSVHGSGISGGPVGSGFIPRNIDIRIRTGNILVSVKGSCDLHLSISTQ